MQGDCVHSPMWSQYIHRLVCHVLSTQALTGYKGKPALPAAPSHEKAKKAAIGKKQAGKAI